MNFCVCFAALDPSGPLFYGADTKETDTRPLFFRLHKSQTCFLQVMHTNVVAMIGIGLQAVIGHADYFVAGGQKQPGCNGELFCSHMRPVYYFREAIMRPALGRQVLILNTFTLELERTNGRYGDFFGIHTTGLYGVFYIDVEPEAPHIKTITQVTHINVPVFKVDRSRGWMHVFGRQKVYKYMVHFYKDRGWTDFDRPSGGAPSGHLTDSPPAYSPPTYSQSRIMRI